MSRRTPKMKRLGKWKMQNEIILYEIRVYEDGCEVVVIDEDSEDGDGVEMILATGLSELDETIAILKSARDKVAKLPKKQQEALPESEEDDEVEEDEDIQ
jgi:hypothetical protein